ncbi:MAG: DnaK suppressor protein [Oceanicoccus sp.]|jgi:DnaK suppressor protein
MRDYASIKVVLEDRSMLLQKRLEQIKSDISCSHSSDRSEQAQERENDEVLNQLGHSVDREIREIAKALQRLENDSYGHCLECAKPIAMGRLKISPEAAFCNYCADDRQSA